MIVTTEGKAVAEVSKPNTGSNIDVARSPTFNGNISKISGFLMAYKLYIRMRIKNTSVEEQI